MDKTTYIIMKMTGTNSCKVEHRATSRADALHTLSILAKNANTYTLVRCTGDTYTWLEMTDGDIK